MSITIEKMIEIIAKATIAIVGIVILATLLIAAVDASGERECIAWIVQAENNKSGGYYWQQWQVDQCQALIGYTFEGRIK